ncbi:hypothetical protein I4U23_012569 [Adineta vaga]|nr:hypothetical protein I4U23_012569 [Adineta vaga]
MSTPPDSPVQLSREETRLLEECERQSVLYRSIPLGVCSFLFTQYAMSKNIISMKAKWVKLGTAIFAGYIIGKVSYTPTCRQKILDELPDSSLAQLIRGVENHQNPLIAINNQHHDKHEHLVFAPDAQHIPVGVNQYGDPIYKSN